MGERNGFWKKTANELPEESVVVDTISPGGMQQTLKFHSGLWHTPDDSMYVYYTPEQWRYLEVDFSR